MKIIKISSLCLLAIFFAIPANSDITQCIKLSASTKCTTGSFSYNVGFSANCDGVVVRGVGVCSSTTGSGGNTIGVLSTSASESDVFCWCKMTMPAVSFWVAAGPAPSANICATHCADMCSISLKNGGNFNASMFFNLMPV